MQAPAPAARAGGYVSRVIRSSRRPAPCLEGRVFWRREREAAGVIHGHDGRGSLSTRQASFRSVSDLAVMLSVGGVPIATYKSLHCLVNQNGRCRGLTVNLPRMSNGPCSSCNLISAHSQRTGNNDRYCASW